VSWNDAAAFCAKRSHNEGMQPFYACEGESVTLLEGTGYRLPTEAEWEFACRAGTTSRFWCGDRDEDLAEAGWVGSNAGGQTHSAGKLKANALGLFDMHGNVWEWVQDSWEPAYYSQFSERPAIDPIGPTSGSAPRIMRGGGWYGPAFYGRSSARSADRPTARGAYLGFRVVLTVETVKAAVAPDQAAVDAPSG
jgi:formylglycine-generating enzyme required for sulfatase activity